MGGKTDPGPASVARYYSAATSGAFPSAFSSGAYIHGYPPRRGDWLRSADPDGHRDRDEGACPRSSTIVRGATAGIPARRDRPTARRSQSPPPSPQGARINSNAYNGLSGLQNGQFAYRPQGLSSRTALGRRSAGRRGGRGGLSGHGGRGGLSGLSRPGGRGGLSGRPAGVNHLGHGDLHAMLL